MSGGPVGNQRLSRRRRRGGDEEKETLPVPMAVVVDYVGHAKQILGRAELEAGTGFGRNGHAHPIGATVDDLLSISPPKRCVAAPGGDLEPAAGTWKGLHVHFVGPRLVGAVGDPSSVGT